MTGRIHSTESMGTVDGPGVRFVVFFQGCPMRCLYCHNPDTWTTDNGTEMTTQEILDKCKRYEPYMKNGGITLTGGEPLLQMDFALELLEGAKKNGIHTCLDTSGATFPGEAVSKEQLEQYYYLTKVADLVMLDIKHIDTVEHKRLTGRGNEHILEFARFLDRENVPMWMYQGLPMIRVG